MTDSSDEIRLPMPSEAPRIRRLVRSVDVRRLLARLAEQLWAGKIDAKTANAITYTLATAARVINDEQVLKLAKRVAALEERSGIARLTASGRRLNA